VLSVGLRAQGQSNFTCDEAVLGKEYCYSLRRRYEEYLESLEIVHKQAKNYGWVVCNESSGTVYAAYASAYPGDGYTRKGWKTIRSGDCRRILTESMTGRNYYIRVERSNGNSVTREEKSFCMWSPQSDGKIYEATLPKCRSWNVGSKSFEELPKHRGVTTKVR